jgi:hypothetical protein
MQRHYAQFKKDNNKSFSGDEENKR